MEFNEYMPRGGWLKYRRRQALLGRVKTAGIIVALFAAHCLDVWIEMGA